MLTRSTRPAGADPGYDCGWRKLALEFAPHIQPWITVAQRRELADALQLQSLCNTTLQLDHDPPRRRQSDSSPVKNPEDSLFVDPTHGSDAAPGTVASPLRTLPRALMLSRAKQVQSIVLRDGTYHLNSTLLLGSLDSGLTITAHEGETAVLSGGVPLQGLAWRPSHINPAHIAVATVPASVMARLPHGITALQLDSARVTRARFPNANPELDLFPTGYAGGGSWLKPEYKGVPCTDVSEPCGVSTVYHRAATPPSQCDSGWCYFSAEHPDQGGCSSDFVNWTVGVGGACDVYDPPRSYWCSDSYKPRMFAADELHTRHPAGLTLDRQVLPRAPYRNPQGAVVHTWRPGHWYTWMFEVDRFITNGSLLNSSARHSWTIFNNTNDIAGLLPSPRTSNQAVKYLGDFLTADACWAACNRTNCSVFTYHSPQFHAQGGGSWAKGCYSRTDGAWAPGAQVNVTSGRGPEPAPGAFVFGRGGNQGGEGSDTGAEYFVENGNTQLLDPVVVLPVCIVH